MNRFDVSTERRGTVALLSLDHAPVNSLSHPMRQALWDALEAADADPSVHSIVIAGAGRGFCAGGELSELRSPIQQARPGISNDLLPRIEVCSKPVIAAVHGFAIGGGLELALACHYRVAQRGARIALPEIKHGVLPPSGSQRLPRAIGVARSLALIIGAEAVPAEQFADTSLFDHICDDDVVGAALEFAAQLEPTGSPATVLLRYRARPLEDPGAHAAIAAWRQKLWLLADAREAVRCCIEAVEYGVTAADFNAGLLAAKQLHDRLAQAMAVSR